MSDIALREFHPFEAAGKRFVYLVPSAAVFTLDDCSAAILDSLATGPRPLEELTRELSARFDSAEVTDTIAELQRAVDRGWRSTWSALHDPYFEALRSRRDFQELIARVDRMNLVDRERYASAPEATARL